MFGEPSHGRQRFRGLPEEPTMHFVQLALPTLPGMSGRPRGPPVGPSGHPVGEGHVEQKRGENVIFHWKMVETWWKNDGNCENDGKMMEKWWKNDGKMMEKWWELWKWWKNDGKMMGIVRWFPSFSMMLTIIFHRPSWKNTMEMGTHHVFPGWFDDVSIDRSGSPVLNSDGKEPPRAEWSAVGVATAGFKYQKWGVEPLNYSR